MFPSIFGELMELDLSEDAKAKIGTGFAENIAPRGTDGLGRALVTDRV